MNTYARLDETACEAALRQGLSQLSLSVTNEQVQTLLGHLRLLAKWNQVHNLTAVTSPMEWVTLHLLDCLAVVPVWIRRQPPPTRLLDVGCGGGFPAVVLATLWPQTQVVALDAVAKKAAFVQQVAISLGLTNLRGVHGRAQDMTQCFDVITARAFSSLDNWVKWTRHALSPQGCWVGLKGKFPLNELQALPTSVTCVAVDEVTVPGLQAERCLVWLEPSVRQP